MSFLLMAPASERVVLVPGAGGYVPGAGESVVRKRDCRVEAVAAFCPVALGGEPRVPETARPRSARPGSAGPGSARPESARPESARPESVRTESVRVDLKRWESASASGGCSGGFSPPLAGLRPEAEPRG